MTALAQQEAPLLGPAGPAPAAASNALRRRCLKASATAWIVAVIGVLGALQLLFDAIHASGAHVGTVERDLDVPWLVAGTALLAYAGYWSLLRKALLARRKLHELASLAPLRRGMAQVWVPGVVATIVLGGALVLLRSSSAGVSVWHWIFDALTVVIALSAAVLLAHCAEYAVVAPAFSARRAGQLLETIVQIGDMAVKRLSYIQQDAVPDRNPITARDLMDVLPDREMTADALVQLVDRLKQRLRALADDMEPWIQAHGVVALLFHPDFLPHISSSELQVSQLRALNIVPRRVQLLTRRWSLSGLESEYVVVHDVSDIRPGYGDPPQQRRAGQGNETAVSSVNGDRPSKWRFLTLKKRAVVHLAPDGALRLIAIEEERQFNI